MSPEIGNQISLLFNTSNKNPELDKKKFKLCKRRFNRRLATDTHKCHGPPESVSQCFDDLQITLFPIKSESHRLYLGI